MAQKSPPREKLPKEVVKMNDHDIMERIFGKRVMKEVDKLVGRDSKPVKSEE